MDSIEEMKERLTTDKLEIDDPILKELWEVGILPEINVGERGSSSRFRSYLRAFEARLGVLQQKNLEGMKIIMDRNEISSKRMERTSKIMLTVAVLTLIAALVQVTLMFWFK